ncbi:Uncharacterised protein [Klebsiella pneumoniae]|nr:Uncharacterised protein [Klebsiella pneumoniae]
MGQRFRCLFTHKAFFVVLYGPLHLELYRVEAVASPQRLVPARVFDTHDFLVVQTAGLQLIFIPLLQQLLPLLQQLFLLAHNHIGELAMLAAAEYHQLVVGIHILIVRQADNVETVDLRHQFPGVWPFNHDGPPVLLAHISNVRGFLNIQFVRFYQKGIQASDNFRCRNVFRHDVVAV